MSTNVPITIMEASLQIIQEAGARIDLETIEPGEKVDLRGNSSGIEPSCWEHRRRTKVFYKTPRTVGYSLSKRQ